MHATPRLQGEEKEHIPQYLMLITNVTFLSTYVIVIDLTKSNNAFPIFKFIGTSLNYLSLKGV